MNTALMTPWPYPRWIAHRGAGKLAPENTLAAFRLGASFSYRMFECDVKLSSDGVPFLLHDDSLERTTQGQGVAGDLTWQTLAQLDAGSWHSPTYAGEPLPSLDNVARFCLANGCFLNIELKPCPGAERLTGEVVARQAARLWKESATSDVENLQSNESLNANSIAPLLSSFKREALAGAQVAAPRLPRGLLLDSLPNDWLSAAQSLGCVAIICQHQLWTSHTVQQAKEKGFRCLSYTVNEAGDAQRLLALGVDGLITDKVDQFVPD